MELRIKKIIIGLSYGLLFGFLSPIPGMSMGTLAIMLNIYDKIFANLSYSIIKKNAPMVLAVVVGWAIGLMSISNIMVFLFENYLIPVSFAFIGLVAGCLPSIYKKAAEQKLEIQHLVVFILAFGIMVTIAVFGGDMANNRSISEMGGVTPRVLVWLFVAGTFSSMSMLIPGIGGSLIMIVFGIYNVFLESIATFNLPILGIFIAAMIIGLSAGAIITKLLLQKYFRMFYSVIGGFIFGSLIFMFPGLVLSWQMPIAIVLAGICFWASYRLSRA